jgi:hypothetical protein
MIGELLFVEGELSFENIFGDFTGTYAIDWNRFFLLKWRISVSVVSVG